jgi:hypothetical protein
MLPELTGSLACHFSWTLDELRDDATQRRLPPPDEDSARERCLRSGAEAPDLATIKDFLRYYASSSDPRIDQEYMTPNSLGTVAEWFFAGFARVTGTSVKEGDRKRGLPRKLAEGRLPDLKGTRAPINSSFADFGGRGGWWSTNIDRSITLPFELLHASRSRSGQKMI